MLINIDFCSVIQFHVSRFHRWFFVYSDIVAAQMSTKTISFQRSISGWIFREDKIVSRIKTFCLPFLWLVGQEKTANKAHQLLSQCILFRAFKNFYEVSCIENEKTELSKIKMDTLLFIICQFFLGKIPTWDWYRIIFSRKTLVFINVMSTQ